MGASAAWVSIQMLLDRIWKLNKIATALGMIWVVKKLWNMWELANLDVDAQEKRWDAQKEARDAKK